MQTKYHSKKAYYKTEVFDSKKERDRYVELCLLEKAKEIRNLRRQVKFLLIPKQVEYYERYSEKTGKRLQDGVRVLERECYYIADFVYEQTGKTIVEDTKGYRTPDYIIKKKLMLCVHKIKIKEV
jgi:hypothetical protein